ncbi:rhomboid family intramembrane serine protease [Lentzea aerocolonigenes]|uniref:rhomboid family intramembrane serine protease n=1 Tax=Lentzea aerocolonigenes TaxID=68170 RepID=UPI0009E5C80E|nr:rhomboid family intramembrane serine protease [Lentzea aerocolonigenes]
MPEKPAVLPPLPGVRTRVPIATIVVLASWAICTALYHLGAERLFLAVRRDPEALAAGQFWRVISPVLVQPDSVFAVVVLGVCAALLGFHAERTFGTGRFLVMLLAGGLAGHIIGEWWQPYSGGVSVAFCGPVGAVAVYVLIARIKKHFIAAWIVLAGAVVLCVFTDIHGPAILAGAITGFLLCRSTERGATSSGTEPVSSAP